MPRPARPVPAALLERPFRGSEALARGWLTHRQLRSGPWQRVFPDVYVATGTPLTHETRARAASVLFPGAVVTGRSAAWLWGIDVDGPDGALSATDVEITLPPGPGRRVPGLTIRRRTVPRGWRGSVPSMRDIPTLWPEYAVLEVATQATRSHVEKVVVLDQACEQAPVTLRNLRLFGAEFAGRGSRQLRAALADADGKAGSPPETRLRLALHAADLPRPQAQYVLRTATGRRVKALDFAWPHLRFALEYDGATHGGTSTRPEARFRLPKDRRVLNEAQGLGWRVYYVTAPDQHDMSGSVDAICRALASRAAELGVPLA